MKGGAKAQRRDDICGDAEDNGILCPRFHYWLVFNLKPPANHIRDTLSSQLSPGTSRRSDAVDGILVSIVHSSSTRLDCEAKSVSLLLGIFFL